MSNWEKSTSSKSGGTANSSTDSQSMEAFVAPIVRAQFAFFELMLQSAFAMLDQPTRQAVAEKPQDDQKEVWGTSPPDYFDAATTLRAGWLATPTITGIEETLNDQFFKPRPRNTQERDILTLKEPSSEFGASHAPAETQASQIHSVAA